MKHAFLATLAILAASTGAAAQDTTAKKKILLISGKPSHGPGDHEHYAGCMLLARCLNESKLPVETQVVKHGWPEDPKVFEGVSAVVVYCDGGGGHPINKNLDQVDALAKKGVGLGFIHYAVEVPKGPSGEKFLDWTGGYFETNWSVNPHWKANFEKMPDHPVAKGVKPFEIQDEWYYHMRFREGMDGVTPILTAVPPDKSRQGKDSSHGGNPTVREGVGKNLAEHVMWTRQRPDGGRGFGFTGGHFHRNWQNDSHRKAALNGIVWIAGLDVPADGVPSATPTDEQMKENLDPKGKK